MRRSDAQALPAHRSGAWCAWQHDVFAGLNPIDSRCTGPRAFGESVRVEMFLVLRGTFLPRLQLTERGFRVDEHVR